MNRRSQVASTLRTVLLVLLFALISPRAHSASNTILITAVYYDTYLTGEPDLTQTGSFALANTGDQVILKNSTGTIVDSVLYEGADPTGTGRSGPIRDHGSNRRPGDGPI